MAHRRAADDFDTIRSRLEELQRERAKAVRSEEGADRRSQSDRVTARSPERDPLLERRFRFSK